MTRATHGGLWVCCALGLVSGWISVCKPAAAQTAPLPEAVSVTQELEPLLRTLLATIATLSDYRVPDTLPPVFEVPQHVLEAKICDTPCNVSAAYIPRQGIFLAGNLDPVREPADRAALLHELVHYLQQGHPKFAQLKGCERELAKEREAYAIQNAYLASIHSRERVAFYDGEFACASAVAGGSH